MRLLVVCTLVAIVFGCLVGLGYYELHKHDRSMCPLGQHEVYPTKGRTECR